MNSFLANAKTLGAELFARAPMANDGLHVLDPLLSVFRPRLSSVYSQQDGLQTLRGPSRSAIPEELTGLECKIATNETAPECPRLRPLRREEIDRCVLSWLDDLYESLDNISDYPPPSDYRPGAFPTSQAVLEGMLRHMRKLCILRYRVVPRVLAEDDFWIWVFFGMEKNRLEALERNPEQVTHEVEAYLWQSRAAEGLTAQREKLAEERVRQEVEAGEEEGSSALLALTSAPERTQALIQRGVNHIVKAVTRRPSIGIGSEGTPADAVEAEDVTDDVVWFG